MGSFSDWLFNKGTEKQMKNIEIAIKSDIKTKTIKMEHGTIEEVPGYFQNIPEEIEDLFTCCYVIDFTEFQANATKYRLFLVGADAKHIGELIAIDRSENELVMIERSPIPFYKKTKQSILHSVAAEAFPKLKEGDAIEILDADINNSVATNLAHITKKNLIKMLS